MSVDCGDQRPMGKIASSHPRRFGVYEAGMVGRGLSGLVLRVDTPRETTIRHIRLPLSTWFCKEFWLKTAQLGQAYCAWWAILLTEGVLEA